jgi:adenosylcobyric acid synthase
VFASLVGTVELLLPAERERVAGFVINKFRGDLSLLDPGLEFLEERTGISVFGVVPHIPHLRIAEEDSVALERRVDRKGEAGEIEIAILRFPRISNYDDFDSLEHENGVVVRYVERPEDLTDADLVILPGSKSTLADLEWMRQAGFAAVLEERIGRGEPVLGVCGGCQMLGETIEDPEGVESASGLVSGLGVFPARTVFGPHKRTTQVEARVAGTTFLTAGVSAQETLSAYEIHMGRMEGSQKGSAVFEIVSRNGEPAPDLDGAWGASGAVVGTMLHGILENDSVRASLLGYLRERRGLKPVVGSPIPEHDSEYDRLAEVVRESLDLDALRRTIGLVPATDRS